jgi:hypothetical protein
MQYCDLIYLNIQNMSNKIRTNIGVFPKIMT